jgi:hypothetical protein
MPKYPTDDPDYRIIRRVPSRYLHYYSYIRNPVIGPLAMCVGHIPSLSNDVLSERIQLHGQAWRPPIS